MRSSVTGGGARNEKPAGTGEERRDTVLQKPSQ
jgi:hypothetical protein